MFMRDWMMFVVTSAALAGCAGTASDEKQDEAVDSGTSLDSGASGAGESSNAAEYASVEDYVRGYCDAYAVRCGVYSTMELCIEDIVTEWFSAPSCRIGDADAAAYCVAFLAEVTCEEVTWTDECDEAVECD